MLKIGLEFFLSRMLHVKQKTKKQTQKSVLLNIDDIITEAKNKFLIFFLIFV